MTSLFAFLRRCGIVVLNIIFHPIMTIKHLLQQFPLMWQYLRDPRVPLPGKFVFLLSSVGYILSPIDLLPEAASVAGGFVLPVVAVLFLLGVLEDFLLGIPLIGKVFVWWAKRYTNAQPD